MIICLYVGFWRRGGGGGLLPEIRTFSLSKISVVKKTQYSYHCILSVYILQ